MSIKIYLDSSDPAQTKEAIEILGKLDGQTTNPSLVTRVPMVQQYIKQGKIFKESDLIRIYRELVAEIDRLIDGADISVEVYADWDSSVESLLKQAESMTNWGRQIYVKFPVIPAGLEAAHQFVLMGGKANMTLVFNQEQAAAAYVATLGAQNKSVLLSPFIGRWDDRGLDGLNLIENIMDMYLEYDRKLAKQPHVQILGASVRNLRHIKGCMELGIDALTLPLNLIKQLDRLVDFIEEEDENKLSTIPYKEVNLSSHHRDYEKDLYTALLDEGLTKFVNDWKSCCRQGL